MIAGGKAVGMAFLVMLGATGAGTTQEKVDVPSLTMTDTQFLSGDLASASPVVLTGSLDVPEGGASPHPAVILLHGSDGPRSAASWNWAKTFNRMGIATLRLDSYTARGFSEIYTNQGGVGEFNNVYDTYRAADVLAADPRIDGKRIAVMGFSRGGIGALYSAMTRFEEAYGPKSTHLAAHIPFYPPCNFTLDRDTELGPEPVRQFHGEADIWNPLAACRSYVERLKAAGRDVVLFTYPDAHHSFDHSGSPSYTVVDAAQTSRACMRREDKGMLVNAKTGAPFAWTDPCVENGPASHFNIRAYEAAEREVTAFVRAVFALPAPAR